VSIAKVLAQRTGQRLDVNREFIGQGLANLAGGVSSSYVSCGSLNRSLPNLEAGARTPLAAVFSAGWLLLLVAVSAGLLAQVPQAAIAGLLLLVAVSLIDLERWRRLARLARGEFAIAAVTAIATITVRLEFAIVLGTLLSLVVFLYRSARPAMRTMGFDRPQPERAFVVIDDAPAALPECPQLKLLRMEGSVYFGATQHVADRLHELRQAPGAIGAPKHLLVMAKSMNFVDPAGAELWRAELAARRQAGGDLYFHRPRPPVLAMWERTGFLDELGRDHVFPDKRHAISSIFARLDRDVCMRCTARVFHECQWLPTPRPVNGAPMIGPVPQPPQIGRASCRERVS
jgi:SulP family sulfate permease